MASDALWAEAFRQALVTKENLPPGAGWLTQAQIRVKTGRGLGKIKRFVNAEMAAGHMEAFHGSARSASGNVRRRIWYRPKLRKLAK